MLEKEREGASMEEMLHASCSRIFVFLSMHTLSLSYHSHELINNQKKKLVAYWYIRNKQRRDLNTNTHTLTSRAAAVDSTVSIHQRKPNWSVVDKEKKQTHAHTATERQEQKPKNNNNTATTAVNRNFVSAGNCVPSWNEKMRRTRALCFVSFLFTFCCPLLFFLDVDDDEKWC